MKTQISKADKGNKHVGWKKTVGGEEWFLGYGVTAGDEADAKALAIALTAKWQLLRLAGRTELTDSDFEEAKELVSPRNRSQAASPAASSPPSREIAGLPDSVLTPVTGTTGGRSRWLADRVLALLQELDRVIPVVGVTRRAGVGSMWCTPLRTPAAARRWPSIAPPEPPSPFGVPDPFT